MIYYKVLKDHYSGKHHFIENELITRAELARKYKEVIPAWYIHRKIFEIVEIKQTETYFSFGCRFEKHEDWQPIPQALS